MIYFQDESGERLFDKGELNTFLDPVTLSTMIYHQILPFLSEHQSTEQTLSQTSATIKTSVLPVMDIHSNFYSQFCESLSSLTIVDKGWFIARLKAASNLDDLCTNIETLVTDIMKNIELKNDKDPKAKKSNNNADDKDNTMQEYSDIENLSDIFLPGSLYSKDTVLCFQLSLVGSLAKRLSHILQSNASVCERLARVVTQIRSNVLSSRNRRFCNIKFSNLQFLLT